MKFLIPLLLVACEPVSGGPSCATERKPCPRACSLISGTYATAQACGYDSDLEQEVCVDLEGWNDDGADCFECPDDADGVTWTEIVMTVCPSTVPWRVTSDTAY